jgi:branched-chain amino acid transport system substrate-binding protein
VGGARLAWLAASFVLAVTCALPAQAADPIRIGFGLPLTGGLAPNGKPALLAMQIWRDDVNAKGGILGRKVEFVYYDDQSNPATVPGLYTKLLDVDKVDVVMCGHGANMIAPSLPIMIQRNMVCLSLVGLAVNTQFHYSRYFSMIPTGPDSKKAFSEGFFIAAMRQNPKPQTVAIVSTDAEFARNAADGARDNAKAAGLKIVYDKTFPPSTTDYTPIVRAIQATNADIVYVGSYPPESVGMIRAANEIGLKTKVFGGGMVGLQGSAIKTQLGPLLNGITNFDFWLPAPTMQFPGVMDLLKKYQAKAPSEGVDLLGYYIPPYAYAYMQVMQQAIEGTQGVNQDKLAAYMHDNTFKTVAGDVKFGPDGEWAQPRVLQVQFQHVKSNDVEQFKDFSTQVIIEPDAYRSGNFIYPYMDAKR